MRTKWHKKREIGQNTPVSGILQTTKMKIQNFLKLYKMDRKKKPLICVRSGNSGSNRWKFILKVKVNNWLNSTL